MPNRIIKESINESIGLSECSLLAQDLYKRLITYADDNGRFNADTMIMRARLYPREYECILEEDLRDALIELAGVGKIGFYTPEIFSQYGKTGVYGAFPQWANHQRVRDSKKKCPDPSDTKINDWYLRRFIPLQLKAEIIERDNFKCKICGKQITNCKDAKRFAKMGTGLFNIDHIVPVVQGGRATLENLRLTCPECNKKRKKHFSFSDICKLAEQEEEQLAKCRELENENQGENTSCENLRKIAANCPSNPIQSNTNPNPIRSESNARAKKAYGEFKNVLLTDDELEKLRAEHSDADEAIEFLSRYIERKGYKAKSHYLCILDWVFKALEERKTSDKPQGSFDTDEFFAAALERSYGG